MKNLLYALTFAFILLKVTGYIDWSWWLVLLPIIGLAGLIVLLVAISLFVDERSKSVTKFTNARKSRFQEKLDNYMKQSKSN